MYVLVVYIAREHQLRFFRGSETEIGRTKRSCTAEADAPDLAEASRSRDELQQVLGTFAERWSSDKYRNKEKYLVSLTEATTSCLDFLIAAHTHTHTYTYIHTYTLEKRSFRQTKRKNKKKERFSPVVLRVIHVLRTQIQDTRTTPIWFSQFFWERTIYIVYIYIYNAYDYYE